MGWELQVACAIVGHALISSGLCGVSVHFSVGRLKLKRMDNARCLVTPVVMEGSTHQSGLIARKSSSTVH